MKSINDMQSQARMASSLAQPIQPTKMPPPVEQPKPTLPSTDLFTILTVLNRIEHKLDRDHELLTRIAQRLGQVDGAAADARLQQEPKDEQQRFQEFMNSRPSPITRPVTATGHWPEPPEPPTGITIREQGRALSADEYVKLMLVDPFQRQRS